MIDYEIKYSKRKTVAIYITSDGKVEVRCPKRTRKSDIEEFINQKQKWIEKKLSELKSQSKVILRKGETSLYLGNEYLIVNTDGEEGFYGEAFHAKKSGGV